ncbi:RING finger protein 112-like isoform X1 [Rhinoderma darwinii]|uniref:RING finger protein 112-like isoform X1 n=1 Tax=Rhinoderma darwinii TaxID=43563 RepID=UPI003F67C8FE
MEQDLKPTYTIFYNCPTVASTEKKTSRRLNSTCPLCFGVTKDPISISCGHTFCSNCFTEYRASKEKFGYDCPSCIRQEEPNEPLHLVRVDENGLLELQERALYRCFLDQRIEEYPVYLISVIGAKRTGKSFLMNYIMKALQSQEAAKAFDLGAEDEVLKGFPWKPGSDKVTDGIWIWSKPFILEKNGEKIAVFLLDTEGSMDIEGERKANIKLCMLTMLLSSHLVYNVSSRITEADIDYLEIYCNGVGSDRLHNVKYFDFLIRDWYHPKKCEAEDADFYIKGEIKKIKNRYKDCILLDVLNQCSSECFLMPHPGDKITSKEKGSPEDMREEFQYSLRTYLSGVVKRAQNSIGSADSKNTFTCNEMFQMTMMFLSFINDLKYNISSPSEMYNMRKNQEKMEEIKEEFQDFLSNWPWWKFKAGDEVANKISQLQQKFKESFKSTNDEDRNDMTKKLETYLITEGKKICISHNIKLILPHIPTLAIAAAAPVGAYYAESPTIAAAVAGVVMAAPRAINGAKKLGTDLWKRWF